MANLPKYATSSHFKGDSIVLQTPLEELRSIWIQSAKGQVSPLNFAANIIQLTNSRPCKPIADFQELVEQGLVNPANPRYDISVVTLRHNESLEVPVLHVNRPDFIESSECKSPRVSIFVPTQGAPPHILLESHAFEEIASQVFRTPRSNLNVCRYKLVSPRNLNEILYLNIQEA